LEFNVAGYIKDKRSGVENERKVIYIVPLSMQA